MSSINIHRNTDKFKTFINFLYVPTLFLFFGVLYFFKYVFLNTAINNIYSNNDNIVIIVI